MASSIPEYRAREKTCFYSTENASSLLRRTICICNEMNPTDVTVNESKLKMKATFHSGLCIFLVIYKDEYMVSSVDGVHAHCVYMAKRNGSDIDFDYTVNVFEREFAYVKKTANDQYKEYLKDMLNFHSSLIRTNEEYDPARASLVEEYQRCLKSMDAMFPLPKPVDIITVGIRMEDSTSEEELPLGDSIELI